MDKPYMLYLPLLGEGSESNRFASAAEDVVVQFAKFALLLFYALDWDGRGTVQAKRDRRQREVSAAPRHPAGALAVCEQPKRFFSKNFPPDPKNSPALREPVSRGRGTDIPGPEHQTEIQK